ncbi:MAG: VOC family protein [Gammaproteobacteria bacterium]|jgi:uncharacterized protein|nr:VOC family protein [Gammaproteobacteria bacterium]MBU0772956.1 VOC family protein [Gammaproteobacteria bacterium]MBU0857639.1 VOC family protein [Gammaproteobacteria bacterium]MBU1848617.1 VOC family protein [Gammaproteobacteria bacterium]
MAQQIYVNLPVKDLERSRAFFTALGFSFNPQFTNELATCMVISDNIFVMLLTEPFFAGFTGKPIADAHTSTEVLVCISRDSRAAVDDMVAKARAAGGAVPRAPQDHGFMYGHGFEDLDGHIWELSHMEAPPSGA